MRRKRCDCGIVLPCLFDFSLTFDFSRFSLFLSQLGRLRAPCEPHRQATCGRKKKERSDPNQWQHLAFLRQQDPGARQSVDPTLLCCSRQSGRGRLCRAIPCCSQRPFWKNVCRDSVGLKTRAERWLDIVRGKTLRGRYGRRPPWHFLWVIASTSFRGQRSPCAFSECCHRQSVFDGETTAYQIGTGVAHLCEAPLANCTELSQLCVSHSHDCDESKRSHTGWVQGCSSASR